MPRKARSDSPTKEHEYLNQQEKLTPPTDMTLTARESLIFQDIIVSLPRETWEVFRIRLAGSLAKLVAHADELMIRLSAEGPLVENKRGTMVANPLQSAMTQTMSSIQSLSRTLGLSASQRGISEKNITPMKKAEAKAAEILKNKKDKSLLA